MNRSSSPRPAALLALLAATGLAIAAAPVLAQPSTPAPKATPPVPAPSKPEPTAEKPALNPPGSEKKLSDRPNMDAPERKVEIWTEARWILEKELEIVKALKSLKGESVSTWQHEVESQQPIKQDFTTTYAVEKPNKLFIENKDVKAYADGQTLIVYSKWLKQYVQQPMPELWLLRDTLEQLSSGQIRSIPGEPILRPGMSLEQTLRGISSVERLRNGDEGGQAGIWVHGFATDDRQPGSNPYEFDRFYSDEDHLIHVTRQNMTAMYQDMADRIAAEDSEGLAVPKKAARYLAVGTTTTYKRELNPKIAPETFVFKPGPEDRKVDKFIFVIHPGVKDQIAMIGKPAPALVGLDFGGKDEAGKDLPPQTVDIPGMKGKVVVLDFWATWCGPCCASLPSMQMIQQKYADKPFVLIGMNREHAGDERKVKPFLARRDITIRQFNDVAGKAAEAFVTTNSIPCVVIIDQEGNIADIENGYLPGKEKELMAKLEKLFAGKPVHTAAELAAIREQVGVGKSN